MLKNIFSRVTCTMLLSVMMFVQTMQLCAKHVYAIVANDNRTGFTHAACKSAVQQFEKDGHSVDTLDLYDHKKEIPFFEHSRDYLESFPLYLDNKARFLKADVLLLVFPIYWYDVPAIVKAWIDMIQGWAYRYESGPYAKPLHSVKKVVVIYSCAQNYANLTQIPVQEHLRQTFNFIGISDVQFFAVDDIYGKEKSKIETALLDLKKICIL